MRTLVSLFTLAALAPGWPVQAAPSPMFEQFERLCLITRAELTAVARAVSLDADWATADNFAPATFGIYDGPFDKAMVRSRPASNDERVLLVSGMTSATGGQQICALSGPIDATVAEAVKAWLGGVKPVDGPGPDGTYVILESPDGRRAATEAERKDRANLEKLMVVVVETGEITTLTVVVGVGR